MADYRCGLYQFLRIIFVTEYGNSLMPPQPPRLPVALYHKISPPPSRKPHLIIQATYHQSSKNLLIVASQPGYCKTLCKKMTGTGSN